MEQIRDSLHTKTDKKMSIACSPVCIKIPKEYKYKKF